MVWHHNKAQLSSSLLTSVEKWSNLIILVWRYVALIISSIINFMVLKICMPDYMQQLAHVFMQPSVHAGFATRGVVDGEERLVQLMIGPGSAAKLSQLLSGMAKPLPG